MLRRTRGALLRYGHAVDWWGVGILLYELICGQPPFYSNDVARVYEKIVSAELKWPVLRLFPPCALIAHAQGSSGVVDNMARPYNEPHHSGQAEP